jgi:hypothetical protein
METGIAVLLCEVELSWGGLDDVVFGYFGDLIPEGLDGNLMGLVSMIVAARDACTYMVASPP